MHHSNTLPVASCPIAWCHRGEPGSIFLVPRLRTFMYINELSELCALSRVRASPRRTDSASSTEGRSPERPCPSCRRGTGGRERLPRQCHITAGLLSGGAGAAGEGRAAPAGAGQGAKGRAPAGSRRHPSGRGLFAALRPLAPRCLAEGDVARRRSPWQWGCVGGVVGAAARRAGARGREGGRR